MILNRTTRNILIAISAGVATGIFLNMLSMSLPSLIVGVVVATGVTFALVHSRKDS
ncbi:MAG TPA: hypothetical protein PKE23_00400 [Anaerolineales bacterium]|nr:hypothetical protein [Anaerolineales bacterium]HNB40422.1 hypothetical protein [Anaerolineales bacterium]HNE05356.1 hypothetical protein [Anaerolineales bacterium]HNF93425.1 hypothetical protein [Anaerolineales bacterium]HNH25877.1 hypothetical protein [Anaerolineales bacterium]